MNDLIIDSVGLINRIFYLTVGNFLKILNFFPSWLSLVMVSCLAGIAFIPVFKYFSNQREVRRIRDQIAAELLAIRIFKDNPSVIVRAQGRLIKGSLTLLWHTLPSLLIMVIPVSFLLTQMSGWYQFRPLEVGETAVITVKTARNDSRDFDIRLESPGSVDILAGPVKIDSQNEMVWKITGCKNGSEVLYFTTLHERITKKLAVGETGLPVSIRLPARKLGQVFLYPFEAPPDKGSSIQSIVLDYGDPVNVPLQHLDWLVVFCVVSLIVFWIIKRFFKVVV